MSDGKHDDGLEVALNNLRLQAMLWDVRVREEQAMRRWRFYSKGGSALEATWAALWIIPVYSLLELATAKHYHIPQGAIFVLAGLVVLALMFHGALMRRAKACQGHWWGRFEPDPILLAVPGEQSPGSSQNP